MNADRRILTPIAATAVAGLMVAAATLGGSATGDAAARKSDRFKVVGDSLCAGQAWPNLSAECVSWSEGGEAGSSVRFITIAQSDEGAATTVLARVRPATQTQ